MKCVRLLGSLLLFIASTFTPAYTQTNVNEEQGMKPYDSWHGGDLDSISMINGAMVLHIPLACFPQRGSLDLCFSVFSNTKNWQSIQYCIWDTSIADWNCSNFAWVPLPRGGLLQTAAVRQAGHRCRRGTNHSLIPPCEHRRVESFL